MINPIKEFYDNKKSEFNDLTSEEVAQVNKELALEMEEFHKDFIVKERISITETFKIIVYSTSEAG